VTDDGGVVVVVVLGTVGITTVKGTPGTSRQPVSSWTTRGRG
jgi:hypothetical protein